MSKIIYDTKNFMIILIHITLVFGFIFGGILYGALICDKIETKKNAKREIIIKSFIKANSNKNITYEDTKAFVEEIKKNY